MSEALERAEITRDETAGLEYEAKWDEDRYDRDGRSEREQYEWEQYNHDRQNGEYAEEDDDDGDE